MIRGADGSADCSGNGGELDQEFFEQVAHPTRRDLLYELASGGPMAELTYGEIVAVTSLSSTHGHIQLVHHHLPKLSRADYIEWDRAGETVRRGPAFDRVVDAIEYLARHSDPG